MRPCLHSRGIYGGVTFSFYFVSCGKNRMNEPQGNRAWFFFF
jgi:hypothetical protein